MKFIVCGGNHFTSEMVKDMIDNGANLHHSYSKFNKTIRPYYENEVDAQMVAFFQNMSDNSAYCFVSKVKE